MFTREYESAIDKAKYMLRIEGMHTKRQNFAASPNFPGEPDYVEFYSYLEDYSETFNSNWQTEDVFGRMDGLSNYVNTRRQISLSFKVPATDAQQAKENLHKISKLIRFLYPGVEQINSILRERLPGIVVDRTETGAVPEVSVNSTNIKTAPILRLKFANMIQDVVTGGGIYGFIEGGVSVRPMKDAGYFTPIESVDANAEFLEFIGKDGTPVLRKRSPATKIWERFDPKDEQSPTVSSANGIFPKVFELSFTFRPLHNHSLGIFGSSETGISQFGLGQHNGAGFPYGTNANEFDEVVGGKLSAGSILRKAAHGLLGPDFSDPGAPINESLASEYDLTPAQMRIKVREQTGKEERIDEFLRIRQEKTIFNNK